MFISPLYYLTIAVIAICMAVANALDINKAFDIVNEGLVLSNHTTYNHNLVLRDSIIASNKGNQQLRLELDRLTTIQTAYIQYLNTLEYAVINRGGGFNSKTGNLNDAYNTNATAFLFIKNHQGDTLRSRMDDLSAQMQLLAVTDSGKIHISKFFLTGTMGDDWGKKTFENVPLTAVVTILNKFENDTYGAEQVMLRDILYNGKTLSSKPATAH